jgi:hypothetical protein
MLPFWTRGHFMLQQRTAGRNPVVEFKQVLPPPPATLCFYPRPLYASSDKFSLESVRSDRPETLACIDELLQMANGNRDRWRQTDRGNPGGNPLLFNCAKTVSESHLFQLRGLPFERKQIPQIVVIVRIQRKTMEPLEQTRVPWAQLRYPLAHL